jgi:hypothetical protein
MQKLKAFEDAEDAEDAFLRPWLPLFFPNQIFMKRGNEIFGKDLLIDGRIFEPINKSFQKFSFPLS